MLPSTAIDQIFGRLSIRYGAKLAGAYPGLNMADVRADWAQVLDGVSVHAVNYALVNLPLEWPPTATSFRELCRAAPAAPPDPNAKQLPAPKPDPDRWRETFRPLAQAWKAQKATIWIDRLEARIRAGETLPIATMAMLENARLNLASRTVGDVTITLEDSRRTDELKKAQSARVEAYLQAHPEMRP